MIKTKRRVDEGVVDVMSDSITALKKKRKASDASPLDDYGTMGDEFKKEKYVRDSEGFKRYAHAASRCSNHRLARNSQPCPSRR